MVPVGEMQIVFLILIIESLSLETLNIFFVAKQMKVYDFDVILFEKRHL